MDKFIKFKNQHFVEENGKLIFDKEVFDLRAKLNKTWTDLCAKHDKTGRFMGFMFNPKYLNDKINEHIETHRKVAYVNQVMRLMKVKYESGTEEYDQILVAYENGTSCEEAARDFAITVYDEDLALA